MAEPPQSVLVSGAGEFLAREIAQGTLPCCPVRSLADEIGPEASRSAPAHTLAILAREIT
jgi:hypothetical protein